jgi:hypothetical protein
MPNIRFRTKQENTFLDLRFFFLILDYVFLLRAASSLDATTVEFLAFPPLPPDFPFPFPDGASKSNEEEDNEDED